MRFTSLSLIPTTALMMCALLCISPAALAQHGGGGGAHGGGGPGGGMPMGGGSGFGGGFGEYRRNGGPPPGNAPDSAGTVSGMRAGLQLGPPGRWWDDKHFAKDLKLRTDQQRRMDGIFEANRSELLKRYQGVLQEEIRMESMTHAKSLDEGALQSQIDRTYQARADLEKARAHYLLQLRSEMDADQLSRLEEHR